MANMRMMTDRKCRIKGVVNTNNQTIVWSSPVRRWTSFEFGDRLLDNSDSKSRSELLSAAAGGLSSTSRSDLLLAAAGGLSSTSRSELLSAAAGGLSSTSRCVCVGSECCVTLDISCSLMRPYTIPCSLMIYCTAVFVLFCLRRVQKKVRPSSHTFKADTGGGQHVVSINLIEKQKGSVPNALL